jgi:acylphosphatase
MPAEGAQLAILEGAQSGAVKGLNRRMLIDDVADDPHFGLPSNRDEAGLAQEPERVPRVRRAVVTLTGRVQGVGFRYRVMALAARHPVAGTVRNLRASNALEIDVQGEEAAVEAFIADVLAHPPAMASVDGVVRQRCEEPRQVDGFSLAPSL